MKLDRFRNPRSVSVVLVLVLGILGFATLTGPVYVHAAAPALVQSVAGASLVDMVSSNLGWPNAGVSTGDLLLVHADCMVGGNPTAVSDSAADVFTQIVTGARLTVFAAFAKASSASVTVSGGSCSFGGSPGGSFSINEYSGVASIGNIAGHFGSINAGCQAAPGPSCTDTVSITIQVNNALLVEPFDVVNPAGSVCPTITNGGASQITSNTLQCLNGLAGSWSQGRTVYSPNRGIGINSLSMTAATFSGQAGQSVEHALIELDGPGGTPSNLGTQTACFGNCGNPAVTLANTNSTHTVAFNQSIELFYSFQSNLNGQVLNITANVAKTYSNGNSLVLGVYTIPSCSAGQPPFSPICPGALQKSSTIQNPSKGMNSFTNLAIPVSNGQWVGLAFTATFGGMDLNDTNTQVPINQASDGGGALNPTVSQSTVFASLSKIGLWGFLTGNVITGIPPPPTTGAGGSNCSGILDCILPSLVFSLCSNQTPQCQNASALVWALILSIISLFFVFRTTGNLMPGVRIPIGEAFTLALIVWIFVLSGLQLLFVWVPLFFFFIAAVIFGKKTGTFL